MSVSSPVIVLGLGAMGSSVLYQLAKRGIHAIGIDRHTPPHAFGSSHGETRITRQAIGEGECYIPLALRSYELMRELEMESKSRLLQITGLLVVTSDKKQSINHVEEFFEKTVAAAKGFQIPHELLDASSVRERFPQFNVRDDERAYYEPGAGLIAPEQTISAQLQLAEKHGARIRCQETVLNLTAGQSGARVETNKETYDCDTLVIAAGAWLPGFLKKDLRQRFKIYRQVVHWFPTAGVFQEFLAEKFPPFIWELQESNRILFGFPACDGPAGGVKLGTEDYAVQVDPDQMDRQVSQNEIDGFWNEFVKPNFLQVQQNCIRSSACLYTVTPEARFVIDRLPDQPNIIICSACSGHGFKHAPAIGESIAQMIIYGKSTIDLSSFRI